MRSRLPRASHHRGASRRFGSINLTRSFIARPADARALGGMGDIPSSDGIEFVSKAHPGPSRLRPDPFRTSTSRDSRTSTSVDLEATRRARTTSTQPSNVIELSDGSEDDFEIAPKVQQTRAHLASEDEEILVVGDSFKPARPCVTPLGVCSFPAKADHRSTSAQDDGSQLFSRGGRPRTSRKSVVSETSRSRAGQKRFYGCCVNIEILGSFNSRETTPLDPHKL